MAVRQRNIGTLVDPTGTATFDIFYDDTANPMLITRILAVNGSTTFGARVSARRNDGSGQPFLQVVQPGATLDANVPTGQASRLQLTLDQFGRPDGVTYAFDWVPV